MEISSRTTEGLPNECPICGKQVWIVPSVPPGDSTCPHCGSTIWFPDATDTVPDVLHQLQKRGAIVYTDDEGQVRSIRLIGRIYTAAVIDQLAKLNGVKVLDVSGTRITPAGVARKRSLMPETKIEP
jgi:hypothetical protein